MNPHLTEQEHRFLRLIVAGVTPTEIAGIFGLSMGRVRQVIRNLCDKYDVDWIGELADAANSSVATAAVADDDDGSVHVDGSPARE